MARLYNLSKGRPKIIRPNSKIVPGGSETKFSRLDRFSVIALSWHVTVSSQCKAGQRILQADHVLMELSKLEGLACV